VSFIINSCPALERFAQKSIDEDLSLRVPPPPELFVLRRHLQLFCACKAVACLDIESCPMNVLNERLDAIKDVGELPVDLQTSILNRHIKEFGLITSDIADEDFIRRLRLITPWGEDDAPFDPRNPKMCCMAGQPAIKAANAKKVMIDAFLSPMIANGPEFKPTLKQFAGVALIFFQRPPANLPDPYLKLLMEFKQLLRGAIGLFDPLNLAASDDAIKMVSLVPAAGKKTAERSSVEIIAAILHGTPAWAIDIKNYKDTFAMTKQYTSKITSAMVVLNSDCAPCDVLTGLLDTFKKISGVVRIQVVDEFEKLLGPMIGRVCQTVIDNETNDKLLTTDPDRKRAVAQLSAWIELLGQCDGQIAFSKLPARRLASQLGDIKIDVVCCDAHMSFVSQIEAAGGDKWFETATAEDIQELTDSKPSSNVLTSGCDRVCIDDACVAILEYVDSVLVFDSEQSEQLITFVTQIIDLDYVDVQEKHKLKNEQLVASRNLAKVVAEFDGLGATLASRVAADPQQLITRKLLSVVAAFKTASAKFSSSGQPPGTMALIIEESSSTLVDSISEYVVKIKKGALEDIMARFTNSAGSVAGVTENWHSGIKEDWDFDAVAKQAKKTILKVNGGIVSECADSFGKLRPDLTNAYAMFGLEDDEFMTTLRDTHAAATRAIIEAKFFLGYEEFKQDAMKTYKFCSRIKQDIWSLLDGLL
jgi:hypothetical protein